MCYSAMVKQHLKQLSFQFRARIDHAAFEDLFRRRLEGEDIKISKALEYNFRANPKTTEEKRIAKLIENWIEAQNDVDRKKIKAQETRLKGANEKLKVKETKKALDDQRIATNWLEKYQQWIERRTRLELHESDTRIWPFWYFPMIYFDGKENVIAPFRYHMRPEGKPESFDDQFDGTYNARRDRLHFEGKGERPVPWWESTYGKKHGIMVVTRFFENVDRKGKNVVVSFDPGEGRELIVPMLYNNWREKGAPPIDGAAAITFPPPPDVAKAGHDRCVGRLRPDHVEAFLRPAGKTLEELDQIIDDHEMFHFKAEVAA